MAQRQPVSYRISAETIDQVGWVVAPLLELVLKRTPELRGYALSLARSSGTPYAEALGNILAALGAHAWAEAPQAAADTAHDLYDRLAL